MDGGGKIHTGPLVSLAAVHCLYRVRSKKSAEALREISNDKSAHKRGREQAAEYVRRLEKSGKAKAH